MAEPEPATPAIKETPAAPERPDGLPPCCCEYSVACEHHCTAAADLACTVLSSVMPPAFNSISRIASSVSATKSGRYSW